MTELMEGLEIDSMRMLANLEATQGLIFSERVAMLLASRLGKASAHEVLETASRKAAKEKRHLKDVLLEDAKVRGQFPESELAKLFEPLGYIGMADEFVSRVVKRSQE